MAARDVILIGALIFTFGMGFFVIHYAFGTITDAMIAIPEINQSTDAVTAFEGVQEITSRLDYVVFGLFFGLVLALIITGWFIGGNPIFMFIYFIVVVLGTVLGFVLANVWETISQSAQFGTTVVSFPLTNNLLLNLPVYTIVVGFIGIVVMFAKPYFGGEE
jgi:hypothetical protein